MRKRVDALLRELHRKLYKSFTPNETKDESVPSAVQIMMENDSFHQFHAVAAVAEDSEKKHRAIPKKYLFRKIVPINTDFGDWARKVPPQYALAPICTLPEFAQAFLLQPVDQRGMITEEELVRFRARGIRCRREVYENENHRRGYGKSASRKVPSKPRRSWRRRPRLSAKKPSRRAWLRRKRRMIRASCKRRARSSGSVGATSSRTDRRRGPCFTSTLLSTSCRTQRSSELRCDAPPASRMPSGSRRARPSLRRTVWCAVGVNGRRRGVSEQPSKKRGLKGWDAHLEQKVKDLETEIKEAVELKQVDRRYRELSQITAR